MRPFLTETLGAFVEWVPVCPEVECGFGTPRESMRLVRVDNDLRLITVRTAVDLTDQMAAYTRRRVAQLAAEGLCGYVRKKDSPSCGKDRVRIYGTSGVPEKSGRGIFANGLVERFPALPVEEEGRLSDLRLRENFVERVFAYWRLRRLFSERWDPAGLVAFHTAHKLILMAHSPEAYRELGRFVARVRGIPRSDVERRYTEMLMLALTVIATPRRHANVLQHMAGYFKNLLDAGSKAELGAAIDDYRRGLVPLVVPVTLLRHDVRVHGLSYLAGQLYLRRTRRS